MKYFCFIVAIGVTVLSGFAWINKDELQYRYDWHFSAKKPLWWSDATPPELPKIENIHSLRKYTDQVLTEPCCKSDKHKEQWNILSKAMYFVIRDNYDKPFISASAMWRFTSGSVSGWNKKEIFEFYMRYYYWVDFTSCASCMKGDLTWYHIESLASIYEAEGKVNESLELTVKYLNDRGHELHLRYHIQAQGQIARYKDKLGKKEESIDGIENFIADIRPEINNTDLEYYFKRLLKTCERIKGNICT